MKYPPGKSEYRLRQRAHQPHPFGRTGFPQKSNLYGFGFGMGVNRLCFHGLDKSFKSFWRFHRVLQKYLLQHLNELFLLSHHEYDVESLINQENGECYPNTY